MEKQQIDVVQVENKLEYQQGRIPEDGPYWIYYDMPEGCDPYVERIDYLYVREFDDPEVDWSTFHWAGPLKPPKRVTK